MPITPTSTDTSNNPFAFLNTNDSASASTISGSKSTDTNQALTGLADNFDSFLKLFLTQLQNQDPTSPIDTNQMTSQLAQFAGVEQAIATNKNLDLLIKQNQVSQITTAGALVGTTIEENGNHLVLKNGKADFTYNIGKDMTKATVTIKDGDGNVVYTNTLDSSEGDHSVTWPGIDSAGNKLADGVYKVEVTQLDSNNKPSDATVTLNAIVTGVKIANGTVTLMLDNNESIDASKILSIGNKSS